MNPLPGITRVRTELGALRATKKSYRDFGWIVGAILIVLALLAHRHAETAIALGLVGAVLVAAGRLAPGMLRYPYYAWMAVGIVLGMVVAPAVFTVLFYLVLTPIGLISRVFGSDPLMRSFEPMARTYWKPKDAARPGHMRHPF